MDLVKVPKRLAIALLEWHSGQGSSLYAVGSSAYAGRKVDTEDVALAMNEIEDDAPLLAESLAEILLAHEENREPDMDQIEENIEASSGDDEEYEDDWDDDDEEEDEEEDEDESEFSPNPSTGITFPADFDDGTLDPLVYKRRR